MTSGRKGISKAKCHPNRDLFGKGLCKECYNKDWWQRNPGKIRLYYLKQRAKTGFQEKNTVRQRKWKENNPGKVAEARLRAKLRRKEDPNFKIRESKSNKKSWLKKYGINESYYKELRQKGCAICGSKESLHLDHDHATGKFRDILCRRHNWGLGNFRDSVEEFKQAIKYIEKHKGIEDK